MYFLQYIWSSYPAFLNSCSCSITEHHVLLRGKCQNLQFWWTGENGPAVPFIQTDNSVNASLLCQLDHFLISSFLLVLFCFFMSLVKFVCWLQLWWSSRPRFEWPNPQAFLEVWIRWIPRSVNSVTQSSCLTKIIVKTVSNCSRRWYVHCIIYFGDFLS